MTVAFASPHQLRYRRLAHRFAPGGPLRLDEAYRLAHLPLIDAAHPDVIPGRDGTDYAMGRYSAPRFSLIVPIDARALESSPAFQRTMAAFARAPFAPKIAWDVAARRRHRLHATLRSNLQRDHGPDEIRRIAARLRRCPAFRARLLGPWMGDTNHGRLYLPLVPQTRRGLEGCRRVQRAAGGPETALYTVGLLHFRDHLTPDEAAMLRALLREHRARVLLEFDVREVCLHATHDNLALDSRVVARIPLRRRFARG